MNKKDNTDTRNSRSPPHLLNQTLQWNQDLRNYYCQLLIFVLADGVQLSNDELYLKTTYQLQHQD